MQKLNIVWYKLLIKIKLVFQPKKKLTLFNNSENPNRNSGESRVRENFMHGLMSNVIKLRKRV